MGAELERVLVVGAGQMGSGIAQVVAASGRAVALHDPYPGATERALAVDAAQPDEACREGRPGSRRDARPGERADDLVAADLMIEAVVEDAAVKQELFRRADAALPPHAILASNTSSIPIASLAAVTGRPDRVIGMHFFNPVPVLELVEVIRAAATSDETNAAIVSLARALGKEPVEVRDVAGFVSNRILMPFLNEAVYALAEGVADAEGIDTVAKLGFAHPLGPLALADLIGLDTCVAIMEVLEVASAMRAMRPVRSFASTSPRAGSAANPAAASTSTTRLASRDGDRRPRLRRGRARGRLQRRRHRRAEARCDPRGGSPRG